MEKYVHYGYLFTLVRFCLHEYNAQVVSIYMFVQLTVCPCRKGYIKYIIGITRVFTHKLIVFILYEIS